MTIGECISVNSTHYQATKKLWDLLRELAPKGSSPTPVTLQGSSPIQVTLKDLDKILSDPQDIANSFNELFANIADAINVPEGTNGTHHALKDFVNHRTENSTTNFDIPPIAEEFVLKEVQSLEDAKSVGLDGLPTKLLHLGANAITSSVTKIFNTSIESEFYPDEWKVAKVVPIHKNGSIQDRGNFHPISILSTLSKLP